ncbi:MAG TPA: DUF4258 domain-containing protein [Myxococcaceae bacterium]|nr:DUF4258 domain-containing protein [Myxococcaceae bacterium]
MGKELLNRAAVVGWILWSLAPQALAQAPDYDALSDRDGNITTAAQGKALFEVLQRPGQLEALYSDAQAGNHCAKRIFRELETSYFPDTGRELAELISRPPCLAPVLRELSGWCVPQWSFIDFLSKDKPGGVKLRKALFDGFEERARQRRLENQLIVSAMSAVIGVGVATSALEAGSTANTLRASPSLKRPSGPAGTAPPTASEAGGTAGREATGFLGHEEFELQNLQVVRNKSATISGRSYSAHALDQMQNRGILPSVVENAIQTGRQLPGKTPGTVVYFDPANEVRVIVNSETGNVVTVIPGGP